jgi:hypothetical protein
MNNDSNERGQSYSAVSEALKGASRSREERETIIVMSDDLPDATVNSSSPAMIRWLCRYSHRTGIPFTKVDRDGVWIDVPKKRVRFSVPRQYSGVAREKRQAAARHAWEARAARRSASRSRREVVEAEG